MKEEFITGKTYIVESKKDELPFSDENFTVKRLEKNVFEICPINDEFKIGNLNLKDVVSIKENTPELEEIIFKLFSNVNSEKEINIQEIDVQEAGNE